MKITFISIFPKMFREVMETSMLLKAKDHGLVEFDYIDLRTFGVGPRKQVDDTPYGGGDGMLFKVDSLVDAIEFAKTNSTKPYVILMTPKGERFSQHKAQSLASSAQDLIFVCARYEGYDERVVDYVDDEISIGDYILTGGELPAMVVADSVIRLIPGVLGGENSAQNESFSEGNLLEYPQYTRPETYRGKSVPKVLLSGNHAKIDKWRASKQKKSI